MFTKIVDVYDVRSREVDIKRGRDAGTKKLMYVLEDGEQNWYTTFQEPIAQKAMPFKGQKAEIAFTEDVKDNGNVYRTLNDIRGTTQAPSASQTTTIPQEQAATPNTATQIPQEQPSQRGGMNAEREGRIMRQNALTNAIAIADAGIVTDIDSLAKLKLLALNLVEFYEDPATDQDVHQIDREPATSRPQGAVSETAASVFDNFDQQPVLGTSPDDDIPF